MRGRALLRDAIGIFENCTQIDAFAETHPLKQPDAPGIRDKDRDQRPD
jgi:hypothetical protein